MKYLFLTTYGMQFFRIYRVVFWETVLLFLVSILIGVILSLFLGEVLTGINMGHVSSEMVIVLGGPNLQFYFTLGDVALISLFIFGVGLYSSIHSLQKYFKLEVREMMRGIYEIKIYRAKMGPKIISFLLTLLTIVNGLTEAKAIPSEDILKKSDDALFSQKSRNLKSVLIYTRMTNIIGIMRLNVM